MTGKKKAGVVEAPDFRTAVKRAAAEASVPVNDYERALVLGQVAELLAAHPGIGGRIAFKGGAIMRLVDDSPRLSKDLDASLVSGRTPRVDGREAQHPPVPRLHPSAEARPCSSACAAGRGVAAPISRR